MNISENKTNLNNIKNDFIGAFQNYTFWLYLPMTDVKLKYRRTALGPIWNILTILITVSIMSVAWATIFKMDLSNYLPRLYFGLTAWIFCSSMIVTGSNMYLGSYHDLFTNIKISIFSIALRNMTFHLYIYFHYLIGAIILIFLLDVDINRNLFFFLISLILIICNYFWISILLGTITAKFRDIAPMMDSVMGAGTLLTPIVWDKTMLGKYENFAYLNPFTFFVEALREPLMGNFPGMHVYLGLLIFIFTGFLILMIFLKYNFKKIIYWST